MAPITVANMRFEQIANGLMEGLDQMGGYLAARDDASGRLLWTLKIHDNLRSPGKEGDVQDVFFRYMIVLDDGHLLIENERGERYRIDPAARSVQALP